MKKLWLTVLILIVLGLVLLASGFAMGAKLGFYLDSNGVHIDNNDRSLAISQLDLDAFDTLSVDVAFCDVKFIPADKYGFELNTTEGAHTRWSLTNGNLSITEEPMWPVGINFNYLFKPFTPRYHLNIYLPKSAKFDTVTINSVSGDLDLSGFSADTLRIALVDGDLNLSDCQFAGGNFDSVSGNINAEKIASDGLTINSISGDIELSGQLLGKTDVESTSGNISLNLNPPSSTYFANYDTVSGNFETNTRAILNQTDAPNRLDFSTISGDISVYFN